MRGAGSSLSRGTSSPDWNSMLVRSGREEEAVPGPGAARLFW